MDQSYRPSAWPANFVFWQLFISLKYVSVLRVSNVASLIWELIFGLKKDALCRSRLRVTKLCLSLSYLSHLIQKSKNQTDQKETVNHGSTLKRVCHLKRWHIIFLSHDIKVYIKLQLVLSVKDKKVRTIILLLRVYDQSH